jgi:hypothetical protein
MSPNLTTNLSSRVRWSMMALEIIAHEIQGSNSVCALQSSSRRVAAHIVFVNLASEFSDLEYIRQIIFIIF